MKTLLERDFMIQKGLWKFVRDDGAIFVVLNDNIVKISRDFEGAFSRAKTSFKGTREN